MTPRRSAHRVAPGAADRRPARAAALPRRPARGPAGVRPAEPACARAGAGRHAEPPRERAADAALLPRGQAGPAGQRDPAAEPARAALADRRRGRGRSTRTSPPSTSCSTSATSDLFERRPVGHARRFPDDAAAPRAQGHVGAHAAGAVAQRATASTRAFRRDPANRAKFMQLFREPRGLTHELRRMNLYGILGRYMPAFGRIVGQMQHDLFHVYTVDEHILMVIRNLRRFTEAAACARVSAVLAADRGLRAQGGALPRRPVPRHRQGPRRRSFGARRARRAALLPRARTAGRGHRAGRLAGRPAPDDVGDRAEAGHHRSRTSSRHSPRESATERRLVALYLLTVADIRGTSPKVWNAWKAKLLEDLFHATRARLSGAPRGATLADSLQERQTEARAPAAAVRGARRCRAQSCGRSSTTSISSATPPTRSPGTRATCYYRVDGTDARWSRRASTRDGAGLQVFVYLPDQKDLFARICGFFGRAGLSILEAKIHTTRHGYALDTFAVHDPADAACRYRETIQYVEFELTRLLEQRPPLEPPPAGRVSRAAEALSAVAGGRDLSRRQGHALHPGDRRRRPPGAAGADRLHAGQANINVASAQDQHAGRARRGRVPDRRRAAARRARAAAPGDRAVRAAARLTVERRCRAARTSLVGRVDCPETARR